MIRPACIDDASRISEISIFSKRMNYRRIFRDDPVSFGEMQVYPLARRYIEQPERLRGILVYDDVFLKGFMRIEGNELCELYVEPLLTGQGIGSELIEHAIRMYGCRTLWVLEKNTAAIRFYARHGFLPTGTRRLQPGTCEQLLLLERK